jgi:hypothetical protein
MSESTPHFAPIVVLVLLGTVVLTCVSLVFLLFGAVSRSRVAFRIGAAALFTVVGGYLFLLGGVSLASSEKTLPPGGSKYFCEIDCHIAYSISSVHIASVLGPEMLPVSAHGQFVIVRLKSWFDESTISPRRGDAPLMPNRRDIALIDSNGNRYSESATGEVALARLGNSSMPLTTPLRPGHSYVTDLVFDVPKDVPGLRLLLTEDDPESMLVIGHENSLLHKKIFFSLESTLARSAIPR